MSASLNDATCRGFSLQNLFTVEDFLGWTFLYSAGGLRMERWKVVCRWLQVAGRQGWDEMGSTYVPEEEPSRGA